jgi:hypothetical protein
MPSLPTLPPNAAIRVWALGTTATVTIYADGREDAAFPERGRVTAVLTFDRGADLDRPGLILLSAAIQAGERIDCHFLGGRADAPTFRVRLKVELAS